MIQIRIHTAARRGRRLGQAQIAGTHTLPRRELPQRLKELLHAARRHLQERGEGGAILGVLGCCGERAIEDFMAPELAEFLVALRGELPDVEWIVALEHTRANRTSLERSGSALFDTWRHLAESGVFDLVLLRPKTFEQDNFDAAAIAVVLERRAVLVELDRSWPRPRSEQALGRHAGSAGKPGFDRRDRALSAVCAHAVEAWRRAAIGDARLHAVVAVVDDRDPELRLKTMRRLAKQVATYTDKLIVAGPPPERAAASISSSSEPSKKIELYTYPIETDLELLPLATHLEHLVKSCSLPAETVSRIVSAGFSPAERELIDQLTGKIHASRSRDEVDPLRRELRARLELDTAVQDALQRADGADGHEIHVVNGAGTLPLELAGYLDGHDVPYNGPHIAVAHVIGRGAPDLRALELESGDRVLITASLSVHGSDQAVLREVREIREAWRSRPGVEVTAVYGVTPEKLAELARRRDSARRIRVWHHVAHGEVNGRLQLTGSNGGATSPLELLHALGDHHRIRLVIFTVCDGAAAVELLRQPTIEAFVGARGAITATAAVDFSGAFHAALAQGATLTAAMLLGRRGMFRVAPYEASWCWPALYLRSRT